jgi:hypothetical protein
MLVLLAPPRKADRQPQPARALTDGVVQNGRRETGDIFQFTRPTDPLEATGDRFSTQIHARGV